MKLAAICCTYRRPRLLGHLIECFKRQTYPQKQRELIILDDAGQYFNQSNDGWRIISIPRRFRTLGEKRNACAALVSEDVEGLLVADDDDIYLPHWFEAHADALEKAEWSRPSLYLAEHQGGLREHLTGGLYHASWAFRRDAFDRVGGYRPINNGEDQELAHRLVQAETTQYDPCQSASPFFVWRFVNETYHVSLMNDDTYQAMEERNVPSSETLAIHWPKDFASLPVKRYFDFGPSIPIKDGLRKVELVRKVHSTGASGPENGMFALQQALTRRVDDGLDWLEIKDFPPSKGALAWFWHYDDRAYANWWNSENQPFVQGPNMVFLNSGNPRADEYECGLLDASNCRGMLCHSDWYRALISQHKGAGNVAPISLCPYPISPVPDGPLEVAFDLLVYDKNGHRPQLLEHLVQTFPRSKVIQYGHYQRNELFDAARRSRVCAYLADDDHGPLALQEILLTGCPVVGMRTGAAFVRNGITGEFVDRLPPGLSACSNESDRAALGNFEDALARASSISRHEVRLAALEEFDIERICDRVIEFLEQARSDIPSEHVGNDGQGVFR